MTAMEENREEDIDLRINTDGGSPESGWAIIAKLSEHKGKKNMKVDGKAYSMGLFLLCYADYSEGLDVSQFLLHRAAYPKWFENDKELMTDAMWENLNNVNKHLRAGLEAKIDVKKLEEMKGVKIKDIFSNESRIDVMLSAKEAKQIGLIDKINPITPKKKAEINSMMMKIAAIELPEEKEQNPIIMTDKKLTVEQLKAEHPDVYATVLNLGVEQEKDRVSAWMTFVEIDAKAVSEGIKEGKNISQSAMADFTMKSISKSALKKLEEDAPEKVETGKPDQEDKTEEQKKASAFLTEAIEKAKHQVKN